MKITSSKLDDIRKAKEEWDAEDDRREAIRKEERMRYRKASDEIIAPVEYQISTALRKFDALEFEIRGEIASGYRGSRGLEFKVACNESRVHDENSALSWNWSVSVNSEGDIVKDSGSWSGLNATTEENMRSLRQSVEALEYLNSINWPELIDVKTPDFKDYYSDLEYRGSRPNFEQQMKEAELEEYVGKDVLLLGYSMPEYESRWNRSVKTWFIILGETPKQYKVGEISAYQAKNWFEDGQTIEEIVELAKRYYTSRYRKDRILSTLEYPFVELNEETVDQSRR